MIYTNVYMEYELLREFFKPISKLNPDIILLLDNNTFGFDYKKYLSTKEQVCYLSI